MFHRIRILLLFSILFSGGILAQKPIQKTSAEQRLQWYNDYLDIKKESVFKKIPWQFVGPTNISGRMTPFMLQVLQVEYGRQKMKVFRGSRCLNTECQQHLATWPLIRKTKIQFGPEPVNVIYSEVQMQVQAFIFHKTPVKTGNTKA